MLHAIMEQVAESARRSTVKFQAELHRRFEQIRNSSKQQFIREDEKYDTAIQKVLDIKKQIELEGESNFPEIIVVDATPKKSASKE